MSELPEIPSEPVHPEDWPSHPPKKMVMTPQMVVIGGLIAFFTVVAMVVWLPTTTFEPAPSDNWQPLTAQEQRGRDVFLANGCIYCHSGFTRPQDVYADQYYVYARASEPGDFTGPDDSPNLFGTIRTGPDLSQAGGYHPDDWHYAHYTDPRFTTPLSIMPRFDFLSEQQVADLIAFTQARGGHLGELRSQHQQTMKEMHLTVMAATVPGALAAPGEVGDRSDGFPSAGGINQLTNIERGYWLADNPLPVTSQNLLRGRQVFQERCQGCHGSAGDGNGPAAFYMLPPPASFQSEDDQAHGSDTSPGSYYWRILRGVPGTAMENFGTRLSVDDIWKVTLFLKTIPNGGLTAEVPTPDMYVQWVGYPGLFDWAKCYLSDATYYGDAASKGGPTDTGGPENIGDVPGIVQEGDVNPIYAVDLWMAEHEARPCGSKGFESVSLADIMKEASARTDGYARQGVDQNPFIPDGMLDRSKFAPQSLTTVWGADNPLTEASAGNR